MGGRRSGYWDNFIALWAHLGYDFVRLENRAGLPRPSRLGHDPGTGNDRGWAETCQGPIQTWEDFERYPWPRSRTPASSSTTTCEPSARGHGTPLLPRGGYLRAREQVDGLRNPVRPAPRRPPAREGGHGPRGGLLLEYHTGLLEIRSLRAIFQGDDMGFKTATLISPQHLREFFLPWHARFAQNAHSKGGPTSFTPVGAWRRSCRT